MAGTGQQAPGAPAPPVSQTPQQPIQQAQQVPYLNYSHFKPECRCRCKSTPAQNNWMNTHQFQKFVKVQRFCLTLVGEARLCLEFQRPLNIDWL